MKSLSLFVGGLFLIAGLTMQAEDSKAYDMTVEPTPPVQTYGGYHPEPAPVYEEVERARRAVERRSEIRQQNYYDENRASAAYGCSFITNNAYAQDRCYDSIK